MPVRFHAQRLLEVARAATDQGTEASPHHTTNESRGLCRAIAKHTGVDSAVISRLLNGKRMPTVETLGRIARAYNIPLDDLVTDEPAEPRRSEAAA